MRASRTYLLALLFLLSMGAGPCDKLPLGADDLSGDQTADTGSGEECGDLNVSCNHSLDIEILLAGDEEFTAGMYTFQITAPDASVYYLDCMLNRADAGLECLSGDTSLLGAVIDPGDLDKIILQIEGAPPECTVQVFYNDYEIGNDYLEPDYDLSYPNGEGCEPVCYNGEDHMAVSLW